jgi:hypothetical protein
MARIEVRAIRSDASVKTLETKGVLTKVFPKGSILVRDPHGNDAYANKTVRTLREDWAQREGVEPGHYLSVAAEHRSVYVNEGDDIGGLRDRLARALGVPAGSIELRAADGTGRANPNTTLLKYRSQWGF